MSLKYKILVLDIDGTLTNSKKEIPPRTKSAILKAQEKGAIVALASGRPSPGITHVANELELDRFGGYVLSFNGGVITNYQTKEVIFEKVLPDGVIPVLYEEAKKAGVAIVSYLDDAIVTETPEAKYIDYEAFLNHMKVVKVDDFVDTLRSPVTKCLMVGDPEILVKEEERLKKKLGDRLNVFRSEPFFLEIMPQNIDKAYSLNKLLKHLKMTREEMIACGDGFNDRSMIEFAGLGVAMCNAQPEVKAVADLVTLTNDEEGVALVVEDYMLKEEA
ncbi:MAG: Cof-type HAD-IIB family hydrolase [Bacteroidales bacterium]|nr:Cof-type HAD-IIB family hydrolase [Bacteroidales bacterium]